MKIYLSEIIKELIKYIEWMHSGLIGGGQKIMKIYISEIIKKLIKPQWTKPQKREGVKVFPKIFLDAIASQDSLSSVSQ